MPETVFKLSTTKDFSVLHLTMMGNVNFTHVVCFLEVRNNLGYIQK